MPKIPKRNQNCVNDNFRIIFMNQNQILFISKIRKMNIQNIIIIPFNFRGLRFTIKKTPKLVQEGMSMDFWIV